jgi:thiamine pyrophosphate-dependent acetolactate synthase large subunit-like protein
VAERQRRTFVRVEVALAEELARQGVGAVFGLIGEDTIKLTHELTQRGVAYYGARHESVAVAMADGYARVTAGLGVALISRGPGVTNAVTALVTAAKGRTRLLVLAGDCDPVVRGNKFIDQPGLFAAAGIDAVTLDSPHTIVSDVAILAERARRGGTWVANLPGSILEEEAGNRRSHLSLAPPPAAGDPAPAAIAAVADVLGETWAIRYVVILAGRGAVEADARVELERLADRCGALLSTTLMAKTFFAGNPYNIGVVGTYANEPAVEFLANADIVLVFGSSLDSLTTIDGALFPKARVIRFDHDAARDSAGSIHDDLFIAADARAAASALVDELDRRGHTNDGGYRTGEVAARLAGYTPERKISDRSHPGALDPRTVMLALDRILPSDRTLVIDNGHHMAFSTEYVNVPSPRAFLSPLEYHCVGTATGMAIGAAIGRPERLTIYAVGDAGLMMTLGDLETAARYGVPLLVVVVNDSALGAELHYLVASGFPGDVALCTTPSFEEVGKALGGDGMTIATLEDLDVLGEKVETLSGPLVVDVKTTREVRADWLELIMLRDVRAQQDDV